MSRSYPKLDLPPQQQPTTIAKLMSTSKTLIIIFRRTYTSTVSGRSTTRVKSSQVKLHQNRRSQLYPTNIKIKLIGKSSSFLRVEWLRRSGGLRAAGGVLRKDY